MKFLNIAMLICCLSAAGSAHAQVSGGGYLALKEQLSLLKSDPTMAGASMGLCVINLGDGSIVAEDRADQLLVPASTMKIATTGAAMSILGKDFRFKTMLLAEGPVDADSSLKGHLWIKGGGDPTLCSPQFGESVCSDSLFKRWDRVLKRNGIRTFRGVMPDESVFAGERVPPGYSWEDLGNYYGAGACGLNFNDNAYTVYFQPGSSQGAWADLLRIEPVPVELNHLVKTGAAGSGDQVIIYGAPGDYPHVAKGSVPMGNLEFPVRGSLPDPAQALTKLFADYLLEAGYRLATPYVYVRPGSLSLWPPKTAGMLCLDTVFSPQLKEIIRVTNHKSLNVCAEAMLRMLGLVKGSEATYHEGLRVLREFWAGKGISLSDNVLADGSGLSASNRLSARQLAGMLYVMAKSPDSTEFINSLPEAGQPGTLRSFDSPRLVKAGLRAKSGFRKDTRAYGGYFTGKNGDHLAFAVIANNFSCTVSEMRQKLEHLIEAMTL